MLFPRYIFLQDFRNLTRKDGDIRIKMERSIKYFSNFNMIYKLCIFYFNYKNKLIFFNMPLA